MTSFVPTRICAFDTSPLLLWLAGRTDPLIIARFKHLRMFEPDDYELLDKLAGKFDSIVTTPHVLTEASNHAHHLKGPLGDALLQTFANFAAGTQEHLLSAAGLAKQREFIQLGITDCALTELNPDVTIITTDFHLAAVLSSKSKPVLNFNNLRQSRLFR